MNYRHIYCKIISYAKSQNRHKGDGNYYESHHILPKSLFPLWKNRKSNKVLLTAREHFFCHQLLAKIYTSSEMAFALHSFISRPNADYKISSKEYERIKIDFSKRSSEMNKGKKMSEESIEKLRKALIGRKLSEEHKASLRGRKRSEECKSKMRAAKKGKPSSRLGVVLSEETKQKMAKAHSGRKMSEETRKKISESMKLRKKG